MRKQNVLNVGKLGIELENVRRWNVTAVARKNISRECNVKKGGLRWEREKVSKKKENGSRTESGGWGGATARWKGGVEKNGREIPELKDSKEAELLKRKRRKKRLKQS